MITIDEQLRNTSQSKPLLVYDGDCGFCGYWVRYWQKLTGTSVDYQPYQNIAARYPEIPIAEFKRAVQYIAPDGTVSSAALASFLTLSHASGKSFWLSLYRRLPGFARLSEGAYKVISTNRSFFYTLSIFFWGRNPEPPTYDVLTGIFLRLLAIVFFVAFYSFGSQALGLIGSHGIEPLTDRLHAVYARFGIQSYRLAPIVFWFNSSDLAIQMVSWGGALTSILLFFNIYPRLCLFVLYVFYLSLIYAGQVFMTFQWDLLLLETAIIAIFLVRYRSLGVWLLRWLVFRFIFVAGIVKITSRDPAWLGLTALNYHFFTQPLPTPLAWYACHFPQVVLKAATAAALITEVFIPFFIFMPRQLRFFAGYAILAMQTCILLTGNYNFFNITTIILCLSLFDDAALRVFMPRALFTRLRQRRLTTMPWKVTKYIAGIFTILTVYCSMVQFNQRFIGYTPLTASILSELLRPFQLVNTYGPFAVMSKNRYEIIIEGSDDGVNWKEYQFKYKPGDIYRRPQWNIPLQPRLDWQMWFAALGAPENSPWFSHFMQRLLENSPEVIALLQTNPFPDLPPVYVRALFFEYTYTTTAEYQETHAWWHRLLVGIYFPAASLQ